MAQQKGRIKPDEMSSIRDSVLFGENNRGLTGIFRQRQAPKRASTHCRYREAWLRSRPTIHQPMHRRLRALGRANTARRALLRSRDVRCNSDFPRHRPPNERTYMSTCQASSSVKTRGINGAISVPGLPFLRIQNNSPSVLACCHILSVKFRGSGPLKVE